ncbi:MAG: sporulation integral membrane protein YtvI [Bacillus sp. (in: Bacteria)]|nr:sporulation integral membrane protein YtvI [Bacillus sp. (in: firmicutes)]MCM1427204.1 sporulation integral membrane protein YtvI [Eubacterium sp.]
MKQKSVTYIKVILNLLTALVILLLCIFLLPKAIMFFMPFIIGWIISLIASPLVRFLEEKLKIQRKALSAFVIIAVLAVVIFVVYSVIVKLVRETIGFINELPDLWKQIEAEFTQIGANLQGIYVRLPHDIQEKMTQISNSLGDYLSDFIGSIGTPTFTAVGNFAKQLPDMFMAVIMTLLSSYFFVADKSYLSDFMKKYMPKAIYYRFNLIRISFRDAVGGYFKAQFKIEVWIYILLVIGLLVLDINYAFIIALGIAFLDLLPVFGTGTVMVPWAVIEILSGEYKRAVGLLIIWCIGQLVRQVIQPKIMGDSIGIDPIPTLFLLYIGYHAAGVLGMIVVLPIAIIVINLNEAGVFDTTKESFRILVAGFNQFRRLHDEDEEIVIAYENEIQESYEKKED